MVPSDINYRFHRPLKRLMFMGAWPPDGTSKPTHRKFFYGIIIFSLAMMIFGIVVQFIDLYLVLGNLKKMTSNFCTSTVTVGILGKMILLIGKREKLRNLQYCLWKDSMKYNSPDEAAILNVAYKRFSRIRNLLFGGLFSVIPAWGLASYFSYKWGPRILPFKAYFPIEDINDDSTYVPALIYELYMGFYVVQTVLESDLVMLGILLQIEAHCQILSGNIIQLNECRTELDENSRNEGIIRKLKVIAERHLEILEYCQDVEEIFNRSMVIQLLGGSFVILMVGVETTRGITEINYALGSQMMYLVFVTLDIYIICYHFTTLAAECTYLSRAAYSSEWYKLDFKARRMLSLIMTRAQKAPRFTYGKLFIIDANAFLHLIKNIYSWLMLLRQLEMK